jgi:hypothetical protein
MKLVEIPESTKIQFIKDMNILYLNKNKPHGTDN